MEIRKGIGVSPGVAIATAFVLETEEYRVPHRTVTLEQLRLLKPPAILAIPRERRE